MKGGDGGGSSLPEKMPGEGEVRLRGKPEGGKRETPSLLFDYATVPNYIFFNFFFKIGLNTPFAPHLRGKNPICPSIKWAFTGLAFFVKKVKS